MVSSTSIYVDRPASDIRCHDREAERSREKQGLLEQLKHAVQRLILEALPVDSSGDPRLVHRQLAMGRMHSGKLNQLQTAAIEVTETVARIFSHGLRQAVGGEGSEDLWELIQLLPDVFPYSGLLLFLVQSALPKVATSAAK
eukprot:CAMPEP_0113686656 /NCGR_PEP_ID=MMETSP0038_2-20120614/15422_1 /TAXON_ID=2898 /ORGANISM="Cryptomonas paramecium" /LENGTH=141 /DNA_ID=CAMNT_0000607025 /DNA_START=42 /DNA_END=464 /DNA_ORIENTATION=+ /assembly_acc=CAM_ASM_000170